MATDKALTPAAYIFDEIAMEDLSLYEIIAGTLLFSGGAAFTEEQLLRFLGGLERIPAAYRNRRSLEDSVSKTLGFMGLYKVIEPCSGELTEARYRLRPGMRDAVTRDLVFCGVLARHEQLFKRLAEKFLGMSADSIRCH